MVLPPVHMTNTLLAGSHYSVLHKECETQSIETCLSKFAIGSGVTFPFVTLPLVIAMTLSIDLHLLIMAWHQEGCTAGEIANLIGCNQSTVYRAI
jgi:hypothetical protein